MKDDGALYNAIEREGERWRGRCRASSGMSCMKTIKHSERKKRGTTTNALGKTRAAERRDESNFLDEGPLDLRLFSKRKQSSNLIIPVTSDVCSAKKYTLNSE